MRSYRNPFRYRTSEQESQQGLRRFLKTFGVGALDILPEHVWERLVLIQSAPGAGKTSLLRTFSVDALKEILARPEEFPQLNETMSDLGAIVDGQVRILGIRLPLKNDYRAINDLRLEPDRSIKVFFRLLDAHLAREIAVALTELLPDADPATLRIEPAKAGVEALEKIGGPTVAGLAQWANETHRELIDQLDSVLPPKIDRLGGHRLPYAIRALDGAKFHTGDEDLQLAPLVMFDDAQDLAPEQRLGLFNALAARDLHLHRWIAERYQALTPGQVIADEQPHRAYTPVQIEKEARQVGERRRRGRGKTRWFERLLLDIADLRSSSALLNEAEHRRFRELLDGHLEPDNPRITHAIQELDGRLEDLTEGNPRYGEWLDVARSRHGYDGAIERRVAEILITRDRERGQGTLFAMPLTSEEFKARRGSGLGEAAALFLRHELQVPFYFGIERLARLASENIEQYITLCGELFEEMLAQATLDKSMTIQPERQEAIVRNASETLWKEIPQRLADGREIQQLLLNVAAICRTDTYRATVPYPPGATATAISMRDRERLLDPKWRERTPGAEGLFVALAGAIAHNLLGTELDYAVKGDRWMVLYVNRLLCPRFGLALGLGGIRERPVEDLCKWMITERPEEETLLAQPIQERLPI
jgi:hypothetical protein